MKPTYKQVTKTRYIEQISQLAEEIFVQHYTKLTPKVADAHHPRHGRNLPL